jgi:hypothetical protein
MQGPSQEQLNMSPRNVRVTQVSFGGSLRNATKNHIQLGMEYICNYATVMESKAFKFSTTYLTSTAFYDTHNASVPVVMEWGITMKKCEAAKLDKNVPYACVAKNSECVNNDAGYACNCSTGYQAGNPYLIDGCTGACSILPCSLH